MTKLTESSKRDFVSQLILMLEENAALLNDQGFDPSNRLEELKHNALLADQKEAQQQEAFAKAKDATAASQQALKTVYEEASATVELMTGLLGKKNNLIQQIRSMRK